MRAVLLDISKAFDRVWHRGLIAKSRSIRVEGNLLNGWFISYLSCLGYYKVAGETWLVLCRFALWDCLGAIACFIGYFIRSRAGNWVKVPPPKTIPRCNPPCRPLGRQMPFHTNPNQATWPMQFSLPALSYTCMYP